MEIILRIAYERATYAEKRLFIGHSPRCKYHELSRENLTRLPEGFNGNEVHNSSWIDWSDDFDLVHYFNQINFGTAPFVVTFETIVPRFWNTGPFKRGADILASDECKAIIAMSDATFDIQSEHLAKHYPDIRDVLIAKTTVMHPPQALVPSDLRRFEENGPLKLLFVGNDFFQKGGAPMLRGVNALRKDIDVKLTIVSDLKIRNNVTCSNNDDIDEIRRFLLTNADWIDWRKNIPNTELLDLAREHHVGLLPTFAETYGYSVLEMQAAGTPVITTNIRALPEINCQGVGWLIEFESSPALAEIVGRVRDRSGFPEGTRPFGITKNMNLSREQVENLYSTVQSQLEAKIREIASDRERLLTFSVRAIERILRDHDPSTYAARMYHIYQSAL